MSAPGAAARRRAARVAVPRVSRRARARRYLIAFWERAYRENVTGMAAMVAFNLALAVFPFALLLLFVFGQVLENSDIQSSVIADLQGLFPAAEQDELDRALNRIQRNSTTIGIIAAFGAIWIGASFWGAMDTAFCRIYHVECRSWVAQKRFSLLMLVVVVLFLAASVVIPVAEGLLVARTEDLPFGLETVGAVRTIVVLLAALTLTFAICALIYYAVPKGHVPWRGVWPGALFVTVTTGIANAVFPFYLGQSSVDQIGGALGFILIALLWFYVISIALLAGGVINALRYEFHATGSVAEPSWQDTAELARVPGPREGERPI